MVSPAVEEKIDYAIEAYVSQKKIIEDLVHSRKERQTHDGKFIEVYLTVDCRPKIRLKPYIDWLAANIG